MHSHLRSALRCNGPSALLSLTPSSPRALSYASSTKVTPLYPSALDPSALSPVPLVPSRPRRALRLQLSALGWIRVHA